MHTHTVPFLPQLLSRIRKLIALGARLYIALVIVQFFCGFMVGAGMAIFGYDFDFISSFLSIKN